MQFAFANRIVLVAHLHFQTNSITLGSGQWLPPDPDRSHNLWSCVLFIHCSERMKPCVHIWFTSSLAGLQEVKLFALVLGQNNSPMDRLLTLYWTVKLIKERDRFRIMKSVHSFIVIMIRESLFSIWPAWMDDSILRWFFSVTRKTTHL